MNIRVDNSYMYKYLEEQHQRDAARTASEQAESRRKEIPYLIARFGGMAAIILSIGIAIYFGNSYKQISEKSNISQAYEQASKNQYTAENDELIDIDALLNGMKTESSFPITNTEPLVQQSSVRNYVIFDNIDFQYEGIKKIVIGRQYDDPDSGVSSSWCYVDKVNSSGNTETIYLVRVDAVRNELNITDEIANSFGASKRLLKEAQKLCNI